jgi:recombination protein RecT
MKERVNTVRSLLESRKEQIRLALPKHLSPDRLLRVSLNAVIRTPKLLECDQATLLGAVMECATLGLEPDCLGQAYLVPYGKKVALIVGYKGLLALARRSGDISSVQVGVVCEKDHFQYVRGLKPVLEHIESEEEDRGDVTHFWAVAQMRDGGSQFEVMRRREVNVIRDKSASAKSGPWVTHYEEMGKKTVLRRLCKLLPASVELQRAVEVDELAESGIPQDLGAMIDVTPPAQDDAPEDDKQPTDPPCGKVMDKEGTACGLEIGHDGECEPF